MKPLSSFLLSLPLVACSNFLDLGGSDPKPPPPAETPAAPAKPGDNATPSQGKSCGTIAPGTTELFRVPGLSPFNIMSIATDGVHVYLAGHGDNNPESPVAPDPGDPMRTASLVRVPVAGGAPEVIEYEKGRVSRDVVLDNDNIYFASEYQEAVLMRPKAGGAVTAIPLSGGASGGIPQSVATDGKGNVFWTTWSGGIAKRAAGASAGQSFQENQGNDDAATWVHADETSVYWIAGRGELRKAPVGGGPFEVLAPSIAYVYTLATDADHVWGISNDEVWKVAKKGGDRVIVATAGAKRDFRSLVVTDTAIYFSDDMEPLAEGGPVVKGPIYKANKDGSNVTAITGDIDHAADLATDGCRLYWSSIDWVGNPGYELVVSSQPL